MTSHEERELVEEFASGGFLQGPTSRWATLPASVSCDGRNPLTSTVMSEGGSNVFERLPASEIGQVRERLVAEFLSSPEELSIKMLTHRAWTAVPIRDCISEAQSEGIARAARALNARIALAVTTEPQVHSEVWKLTLDAPEIRAFDANCMLRAFLLVPDNQAFVLLEEGDYYYVLAGPERFIEAALGGTAAQHRELFRAYAERSEWPPKTRDMLLRVHAQYSPKTPE